MMMTDAANFTSMLLLGILGAGHCIGMCGGISIALGMAVKGKQKALILLSYNFGRVFSYSCAGALVGLLAYWGTSYLALGPVFRMIAGVLLILMGFYIAGWWKVLTKLERLGTLVWKKIQPLANTCFPVKTVKKALFAGMIWGWLPCGLVYSALAYAATAASPIESAAMMFAFGLGTMPAVLLGGTFPDLLSKALRTPLFRQIMGLILICYGLWVLQKLNIPHMH